MTREQIEKEIDVRLEEPDNEWDGIFNSGYSRGFRDGVQWRINSVWHSTDDLPKHSGFLAVLMDNGIMETMYYSAGIGFHEKTLKGYALWAYISDLLPERKEEAKWVQ